MIENESSDSRHEFTDTQLPESMTPERILEPSAERAATRIEAWYPLLEPRLAKCLTDPNVVLTLSDARAQTETYFKEPEPGDESEFHKLSLVSEADGIRFETSRIPGKSTLMINIENLAGYKNVSETTRLPGIPTFDPVESWEGVRKWQEAAVAGVNAAAERGEYPAEIRNEKKDQHTVLGVMKGYPDAAIISMIEDVRPSPDNPHERRHTKVPYSDYYKCAQPNYGYAPENEPAVGPHVAAWGKILENYYTSPTHERLERDPEFIEARKDDKLI